MTRIYTALIDSNPTSCVPGFIPEPNACAVVVRIDESIEGACPKYRIHALTTNSQGHGSIV
jgi:hypothetical protein